MVKSLAIRSIITRLIGRITCDALIQLCKLSKTIYLLLAKAKTTNSLFNNEF